MDERLKYYSQTWAKERIANNEDPRDAMAFVEHLKDIGADYTRPEAFGLPFSINWAPTDLRGNLPVLDLNQWSGSHSYYTRPLSDVIGITLHYTAGSPTATPQIIAEYQISAAAAAQTGANPPQPFPGIAYHLFVEDNGVVSLCWGLDTRVWHSGAVVNGVARNASHIGICYAGNYRPNIAQREGIKNAIAWCERQLGRQLLIEGHGDVYQTTCPGPNWPAWKASVTPLRS